MNRVEEVTNELKDEILKSQEYVRYQDARQEIDKRKTHPLLEYSQRGVFKCLLKKRFFVKIPLAIWLDKHGIILEGYFSR